MKTYVIEKAEKHSAWGTLAGPQVLCYDSDLSPLEYTDIEVCRWRITKEIEFDETGWLKIVEGARFEVNKTEGGAELKIYKNDELVNTITYKIIEVDE